MTIQARHMLVQTRAQGFLCSPSMPPLMPVRASCCKGASNGEGAGTMCRTDVLLPALQQAPGALLTCRLLCAALAGPRELRAGREHVLVACLVQPIPSAHVVCHVQLLGQEGSKKAGNGRRACRGGESCWVYCSCMSPFIPFPPVGVLHSSPQSQFWSLSGYSVLLWL